MELFKTEQRTKREAKWILIYEDYRRLNSEYPHASLMRICETLGKMHHYSANGVRRMLQNQYGVCKKTRVVNPE